MRPTELTNVQVLRACAATLVVIFHTLGFGAKYGFDANHLAVFQDWGDNGVDLFFVISGFIMVYIQKFKNDTPWTFSISRILRICPLYWLLTAAILVAFMLMPGAFNTKNLNYSWAFSSFLFMSQLLFGKMPLLFDGWSLEYEMLFYLIFATSLFFSSKITARTTATTLIVVATVLTKNLMILEFGYGMLIGWLVLSNRIPASIHRLALPVGVVLFLMTLIVQERAFVDRAFCYGLPSGLIVLGAVKCRQCERNIITKFGDASYSIYLSQVIVIPVFYKLASKVVNETKFVGDALAIACVILTLFSGYVVFQVLERRVTTRLNQLKTRLILANPV